EAAAEVESAAARIHHPRGPAAGNVAPKFTAGSGSKNRVAAAAAAAASRGSATGSPVLKKVVSHCHTIKAFPTAVAPISPPTPGHYHVLYRGCGEMQLGQHGETYCLVGGYRVYGDVALAMPAKVEAEKQVPRRGPKRNHAPERSDKDLGFPRPKIRRLKHSSSSGIQGALILKQRDPTSGHIPSATAPVNECPIFAFSRLREVLSLSFSESDQIVLETPFHTVDHQWLPFLLLHLVTTLSSTERFEKRSWAGMGRHTAWLVATGPMGMLLWPRQQRWKRRSLSPDVLSRESTLWECKTKIWFTPDPKSSHCSMLPGGGPHRIL
ncbi:hypothetical protein EI555_017923, partial [Monodon monoceros]